MTNLLNWLLGRINVFAIYRGWWFSPSLSAAGLHPKDFRWTVNANGSIGWEPRDKVAEAGEGLPEPSYSIDSWDEEDGVWRRRMSVVTRHQLLTSIETIQSVDSDRMIRVVINRPEVLDILCPPYGKVSED